MKTVSFYTAPIADTKATPAPKAVKLALSIEEGKAFLERVGALFGVPRFAFYRKCKSGKPSKAYAGVNLSEIRKVVAYRLAMETSLFLSEIAEVIGVIDHTSALRSKQRAVKHFECEDQKFLSLYERVKEFRLTSSRNNISQFS